MRGRRRTRIVARVDDGTAAVSVTWFNQPWLADRLRPGTRVRLRGKLGRFGFEPRSYDVGDEAHATADFAPVYPAAEEIAAATVRRVVDAALPLASHAARPAARRAAGAGRAGAEARRARRRAPARATSTRRRRDAARLAFEELLVLQIGIARRVAERERTLAPGLGEPGDLIRRYREALPFALTPYQEQAIREIDGDLARTVPMQRLLQGDVGSGKTVVALYALLRAVESGRQGALMAPTETLAEQHFLTIADLCLELGVTARCSRARRRSASGSARSGAEVVVGTHALIQEGIELRDLAVAVVDEQHRFGVEQRSALAAARAPHVLHMTATPIPRTLALTVYGDLAVSEIAKPPASRKPVDHELDHGGAGVRGVHAADAAAARGPAGVRRLPADRGVRDLARAGRRGRGRAAAPRRAARVPRRLPARAAQDGRAARADGALQGARARRPRRDDGDRGRRRRRRTRR